MTLAPSPALDATLDVAQALDDALIETEHGVLWQRTVDAPEPGGCTL